MQNQPTEPKLTLKPARLDFVSNHTQTVFAGVISLFVVLIAWAPSLQCGFLLDDFLHLNYVSRAFHGDWGDFLSNFYSNWAGSDIMKSFRPLVSLSIFIDFMFWQGNAWGYHLTNLLLLATCSFLTGLITLELTGIMGNRLRAVASVWAALLFAIYPLQAESTSWIIGRVDLLCTMFYLASVFCYLRFRLIREKKYFVFSLASFVAAILSKEMAYTLPVVITAAAVILKEHSIVPAPEEYKKKMRIQAQTAVLSYWTIAGIGLMSRFVLLGTIVGGYGDGGAGGSSGISGFIGSLRNFLNAETIKQILFPINLDLIARAPAYELANTLTRILTIAYTGILSLGVVRLLMNCMSKRVLAFLAIWTAISILPTFQIWHISPNMVGSRLFFLGSAPAIMILVLLALPAIDAMRPAFAKVFSVIGGLLLMVVLTVWTFCLQLNQVSWLEASHQVQTFIDSVAKSIAATPADKKVLILNLPTDYSGAGMITRPQYLAYALSQPYFPNNDLATRVQTIEPLVGGSHDYVWPSQLQQVIKSDAVRIFQWKESGSLPSNRSFLIDRARNSAAGHGIVLNTTAESHLAPWKAPMGGELSAGTDAPTIEIPYSQFRYVPANDDQWWEGEGNKVNPVKRSEWTVVQNGGQRFEEIPDGLMVSPGTASGIIMVADLPKFNPLEVNTASIVWKCLSGTCPQVELLWKPDRSLEYARASLPLSFSDAKTDAERTKDSVLGQYSENIAWLGRARNWSLENKIEKIALKLPPGNYSILLRSIKLGPQDSSSPKISLNPKSGDLDYDASEIKNCSAVKLIGLAPNKTFDAAHAGEVTTLLTSQSGAPIIEKIVRQTSGKITTAELAAGDRTNYFVRMQALNAHDQEIGLPSEPLFIERKTLGERR